jgi:hypothetical protein
MSRTELELVSCGSVVVGSAAERGDEAEDAGGGEGEQGPSVAAGESGEGVRGEVGDGSGVGGLLEVGGQAG